MVCKFIKTISHYDTDYISNKFKNTFLAVQWVMMKDTLTTIIIVGIRIIVITINRIIGIMILIGTEYC